MNVFLDNNLPVSLGRVVQDMDEVQSVAHVKRLGLRDASDAAIFQTAKQPNAILLTKDEDFLHLVMQRGPPPKIVLLRFGNCALAELKILISAQWPRIVALAKSESADHTILRRIA